MPDRLTVEPLGFVAVRLGLLALAYKILELGGLEGVFGIRLDHVEQRPQVPQGVVMTLQFHGQFGGTAHELAVLEVETQRLPVGQKTRSRPRLCKPCASRTRARNAQAGPSAG